MERKGRFTKQISAEDYSEFPNFFALDLPLVVL